MTKANKPENISLIIDSVCKELNITYCSTNAHDVEIKEDFLKMSKFYLQLKEMIGILKEIIDRHNFADLRNRFDIIIKELDNIDHEIIFLAKQLKEHE